MKRHRLQEDLYAERNKRREQRDKSSDLKMTVLGKDAEASKAHGDAGKERAGALDNQRKDDSARYIREDDQDDARLETYKLEADAELEEQPALVPPPVASITNNQQPNVVPSIAVSNNQENVAPSGSTNNNRNQNISFGSNSNNGPPSLTLPLTKALLGKEVYLKGTNTSYDGLRVRIFNIAENMVGQLVMCIVDGVTNTRDIKKMPVHYTNLTEFESRN